jgi:hypothetical protein
MIFRHYGRSRLLILRAGQPKHSTDEFGFTEASGHIDSSAIGQRNHRADTGDCHQAPAHLIVLDNGQQAAMQNSDLLAHKPADNKQRLDQFHKVGKALDELFDARLKLHRSYYTDLETEVAQRRDQQEI